VVNIGRRGGKTTLAVEEMKCLGFSREARICYIAPTYQQARDIAWEALKKELLPIAVNINESRLEIRVKTQDKKESIYLLRGWESIETLRGQAFDFIVLDEVAMMRNFWMQWQEVIRPTLSDRKGQALFISTPKGFNHFYDLYNLEATDQDFKSFHFTTYDNPHIPKEEVDKAREELTEDRFAQEYLADFRKTEGLVYKEFSRERHLYGDKEEQQIIPYETLAGVDFGFTHPCAVVPIVKDSQRRYWVGKGWYHTGKTEDEIGDYIAGKSFQKVYPDPENASAIETLRRKGVNIREVNKGKDSVISGINIVRELLKQNRLFIHKEFLELISEFETYSYQEKKEGSDRDELPLKEHDDALDAMRYALMMSETTISNPRAQINIPKASSHTYGRRINPQNSPLRESPIESFQVGNAQGWGQPVYPQNPPEFNGGIAFDRPNTHN